MRWIPPLRMGASKAPASRGACLLAGLTFLCHASVAENGYCDSVAESALAIEIGNTSVRRILESISTKEEVAAQSGTLPDQRVTISLDSTGIADAIARLLQNESYILLMPGDNPDGREAACGHLWILSGQHDPETAGWSAQTVIQSNTALETEWYDALLGVNSGVAADREEAMFLLGENHRARGIELLRQGLSDSSRDVRQAAIESLADIGGRESVLALGMALAGADVGLRISAIDALGEIGGEDSARLIRTAMADADSRVREAAAAWLAELTWHSGAPQ